MICFFELKLGAFVNDKLNIEKLEKKIEKLEKDINKLCNKDKTFSKIEKKKKKKCKQLVICSECCVMR
jgi:uncharacterized protein YutD